MNIQELIEKAIEVRKLSYSPYSEFKVGAALIAKNGEIFTGCNVENAAFTPTCCAERVAIYKAISNDNNNCSAIAICGGFGDELQYCNPCGVCLQVLMEFYNPDEFIFYIAKSKDEYRKYYLKELLPHGFSSKSLEK